MALAHSLLTSAPPWLGAAGDDRKYASSAFTLLSFYPRLRASGSVKREASVLARVKVAEAPATAVVENNGQIEKFVEIPVTCYQILGISEKAEKDEVVKAAMELKNSVVEEGYTAEVALSRKNILMDVRDKLLFEPEYTGNMKEKVPPRCSLRIPWAWLPGALCLLQEVGEEKLVLDIGKTAVQHPDAKPYVHDLLLGMALAECSLAKSAFEKYKISEGFEALARAQYLLRSKISLEKMPLLSQIEESLEELAPACTLELLGIPQTPENTDRRRGAISALRELLRQGIDVESSCRVQDWPCFLSQAINKLMATEVVDLASWDTLAIRRKNKKSLESQSQRAVIDFNCFYQSMIAHLALGFSTRQTDLIHKAKTICECLLASDGVDLRFEEAFCSLLLGQGGEAAIEKLGQLGSNENSALWNRESTSPHKEKKEKGSLKESLEIWLKDAVLNTFPDTRDCSPSLANFFGSPKRSLSDGKHKFSVAKPFPTNQQLPRNGLLSNQKNSVDQSHITTRHLGEAVKQLAPRCLQSQSLIGKTLSYSTTTGVHLKRNPAVQTGSWEGWCLTDGMRGRFTFVTLIGFVFLGTCKLFSMQLANSKASHMMHSAHQRLNPTAPSSMQLSSKSERTSELRNSLSHLGIWLRDFGQQLKHSPHAGHLKNAWPEDDLSSLPIASATVSHMLQKRTMPRDEAEALVKQWQEIKADALGPDHHIQVLCEILEEPMLSKWLDLASSAKAKACFWKFVLLELSIERADIVSIGDGNEVAEIEALLQEAAELVDESQSKNPNYYCVYRTSYILKRQRDGIWKFCGSSIQNLD